MDDRVPLSQPQEQSHDEPDVLEVKDINRSQTLNTGDGIDKLQTMRELRILMGFDGPDWGGMGRDAEYVYRWATKNSIGVESVAKVKSLIKQLGIQSTGKELLRKVSEWVRLDLQKQEIERRQENI